MGLTACKFAILVTIAIVCYAIFERCTLCVDAPACREAIARYSSELVRLHARTKCFRLSSTHDHYDHCGR